MYVIDPLSDNRWDDLVASHPRASVFHQRGWLQSLACTYSYKPLVLTETGEGQPLRSGIPFCLIKSWITGHRLVSLPFADHCQPLLGDSGEELDFAHWVEEACRRQNWRYVELRPLSWNGGPGCPLAASATFWFHTLDLTSSLENIFRGFHKDSIQRRIRHAEREHIVYETGRSEQLFSDFYHLLLLTRRRHQLLPQPRAWFRNLRTAMGGNLQMHLARKESVPIAGMLTLCHRNTMVYKYGCSDARFHRLGGMPLLFWRLIEQCKAAGVEQIDLGRTDMSNPGLSVFKGRFGAKRQQSTYLRCPKNEIRHTAMGADWPVMRSLFSVLPDAITPWLGRLAYRHMG